MIRICINYIEHSVSLLYLQDYNMKFNSRWNSHKYFFSWYCMTIDIIHFKVCLWKDILWQDLDCFCVKMISYAAVYSYKFLYVKYQSFWNVTRLNNFYYLCVEHYIQGRWTA